MEKPCILHMFTTAKNLSPFDVNMAIDAGWVVPSPYTNVEPSEIKNLVQDVIFSRSPKGLRKTGIFIGGRNVKQALDMLKLAQNAMQAPFAVSVLADPSGAFTTAAAMVAVVEKELAQKFHTTLEGKRLLVLGGTGPVGKIASVLAATAGAKVTMVGRQLLKVRQNAELCNDEFGDGKINIDTGINADLDELTTTAQIIFATGVAGVQLLNAQQVAAAVHLQVAADINAVNPLGIAGVAPFDMAKPLAGSTSGAVAVGALAIGNVKYQTQNQLLKQMISGDKPLYLRFEDAFALARQVLRATNE